MKNSVEMKACLDIYVRWHECARSGDVPGILALYAEAAVFESPLVPVLTDGKLAVCRGHQQLRRFFEEGTARRPNDLVRWYRTGRLLADGQMLTWEYPRATPDGEQVDICEVMDIEAGRIRHHRIYWGWFGLAMLARSKRVMQSLAALEG